MSVHSTAATARQVRERYISTGKAREVIERQQRTDSAYVFPSPASLSRPVSRTLSLWYLVRTRAGIEDVRLHDLRHSYASVALAHGETILTIGRLLGHNDPATTLKYKHLADAAVHEAAETLRSGPWQGGLSHGLQDAPQ